MPVTKVIRYRTKPEHADENERLIRAVSPSSPSRAPGACTTPRSVSTTG